MSINFFKKWLTKENLESPHNNISYKIEGEEQPELQKILAIEHTHEFISELQKGNIKLGQAWLNYIAENREKFKKYNDKWLIHQQQEIVFYQKLKNSGQLKNMIFEPESKLRNELWKKYGFNSISTFEKLVENRKFKQAQQGLKHIEANKLRFYFLIADWENWLKTCKDKLAQARKNPNY